jgi:hypothetical protein
MTTSFIPLGANVKVKASPSRRAQRSITHVGATAHASVCTTAGDRGPGGSWPTSPRPPRAVPELGAACGSVGRELVVVLAIPTR